MNGRVEGVGMEWGWGGVGVRCESDNRSVGTPLLSSQGTRCRMSPFRHGPTMPRTLRRSTCAQRRIYPLNPSPKRRSSAPPSPATLGVSSRRSLSPASRSPKTFLPCHRPIPGRTCRTNLFYHRRFPYRAAFRVYAAPPRTVLNALPHMHIFM